MTGTIRRYIEERGFGFIIPDDGSKDMFVHIKAVRYGEMLKQGDRVEYEEGLDDRTKRPRAENVRVLSE